MVKKTEKNLYKCEQCGFHYEDERTAKDCEAFCFANHACNIEIIQKAVENKGTDGF